MRTLIFVYNAQGGLLNAARDAVHKLVSPATYPCSLCVLTYGAVSKRPAWRAFLARVGLPALFLYRDEFRAELDTRDLPLPAILIGGAGPVPEVLVSASELDGLADLDALIALVEARVARVSR
ncbi:MAG: hypothetical protein NBV68_13145 [Erythrobacter sp.]|uniref:hypothetical protein n=1 Tax=Erythrobacter sp. TaxID=1042 RepID=UPI0025D8C3F6|nr:hypothetical protein [Erythrobacter sp.]MCM0000325.1 hypothetical protein [Erythrobacter sp.]